MAHLNMGSTGDAPRRAIFGKIGLALSLVPLAIVAVIAILRPG